MSDEKNITAESLTIVDAKGRQRIVLEVNTSDSPVLSFFDKDGAAKIALLLDATDFDRPHMYFLSDQGLPRIAVRLDENGDASIRIADSQGKSRLVLRVGADDNGTESGQVSVADATGAVLWKNGERV